MLRLSLLLMLAVSTGTVLTGCVDEPSSSRSPYADHLDNEVRGLSTKEIEDLRNGAGMGFALAAEVNGWPGPLHALELADDLGLAGHQREELERLRAAMLAEAVPLGEAIVAAHGRLEAGFRSGSMDTDRLMEDVATLEGLYAELRVVHLATHLAAQPLFTQHQLAEYDRLRGYSDDGAHEHSDDPQH